MNTYVVYLLKLQIKETTWSVIWWIPETFDFFESLHKYTYKFIAGIFGNEYHLVL